jgi:hypothetical protein
MTKAIAGPDVFQSIHDRFRSPVSRYDCGRFCAPLNGGQPVCCTTDNAIPVVARAEWQVLRGRTDLWHRFRPRTPDARKVVEEMHKSCVAIECKGARFCERDNRTLACRAFPFAPYLTRESDFVGLAYYWLFEDRCWVISNLGVVEPDFVAEFVAAYEELFAADAEELAVHRAHSATMRRLFSRRGRPIPLIGRDGAFRQVLPHGGGIVAADPARYPKHGPYRSPTSYARAVKAAGGTLPDAV